jgi:predicted pyridoxine 5'-phosphate oxidase superfamily flavin-nucleotide-binding protein
MRSLMTPAGYVPISSEAELRDLLGEPAGRAVTKERSRLHDRDKEWLAVSPFCLIATADASGNCDVSPKGDPPGFAFVLDDTTIAIPDRPGNRRADGFRNILSNPQVGMIFLVPGRGETLRINGRARLLRDQGSPAAAGAGHRDRADLLPLPQGVHAVLAVEAGNLEPRRAAVARRDHQERPGDSRDAGRARDLLRAKLRGSPISVSARL